MGRSRMDTSVTNQGRGKKELARLFKEIKDLPRQIAENSSRKYANPQPGTYSSEQPE